MKILVSEISYNKASDTFEAINSEQSDFVFEPVAEKEDFLAERIKAEGTMGFIADIYPYTGELYEAMPEGAVISRYGVGHDSIDKEKATAAGITVCNTPGVLDNAVAEHAVWMLGALARKLGTNFQFMVAGKWAPQPGIEVAGRKVAILGSGRIGQRLARKLGIGLGMHVIAMDVRDDFTIEPDSGIAEYTTSLVDAISDADFVITLLPVLESTKRIVNSDFLSGMKQGAFFINSARGALVDESALFDALTNGHLAGAALDVFEAEPYVPVDPAKDIRTLPNIFLTPHIGSNTTESNRAMARTAANNIMTFLKTGSCENIVAKP
ncbi:MAG: NAD(P)-dependent oxidoreductase [Luteolibacter sp.]